MMLVYLVPSLVASLEMRLVQMWAMWWESVWVQASLMKWEHSLDSCLEMMSLDSPLA